MDTEGNEWTPVDGWIWVGVDTGRHRWKRVDMGQWAGWGRYWNFDPPQCLGLRPEILDRYITLSCLQWLPTACLGLSGSRDWSHGESHGPDRPMPAAILENFHCEQPCCSFLGLLKFLCSQTLPNLVNCVLIIFSLVWHPKDFAQIKITNHWMEKMHQTQAIEVRLWKTSAFV